jgi:hypothetical protein
MILLQLFLSPFRYLVAAGSNFTTTVTLVKTLCVYDSSLAELFTTLVMHLVKERSGPTMKKKSQKGTLKKSYAGVFRVQYKIKWSVGSGLKAL